MEEKFDRVLNWRVAVDGGDVDNGEEIEGEEDVDVGVEHLLNWEVDGWMDGVTGWRGDDAGDRMCKNWRGV